MKKDIKSFINSLRQDAVVYSVTALGNGMATIKCYSPVWKNIVFNSVNNICRGDILSLERVLDGYTIVKNKTAEQIKQDGINKILCEFDPQQRKQIIIEKLQNEKQK